MSTPPCFVPTSNYSSTGALCTVVYNKRRTSTLSTSGHIDCILRQNGGVYSNATCCSTVTIMTVDVSAHATSNGITYCDIKKIQIPFFLLYTLVRSSDPLHAMIRSCYAAKEAKAPAGNDPPRRLHGAAGLTATACAASLHPTAPGFVVECQWDQSAAGQGRGEEGAR